MSGQGSQHILRGDSFEHPWRLVDIAKGKQLRESTYRGLG
jgi:hypothetical protein